MQNLYYLKIFIYTTSLPDIIYEMKVLKNIKRWPIESFVFCFSVLVFLFTLAYFFVLKSPVDPALFFKLIDPRTLVNDFLGGAYFRLPFLVIFIYLFIRFQINFVRQIFTTALGRANSKVETVSEYYKPFLPAAKDFIFTLVYTGFSLVLFATTVKLLFLISDVERIVEVSSSLMNLDRALFGNYPIFSIHILSQVPYLERLILLSYRGLFSVLAFLFLFLFLSKNKELFRKFILSFFLSAFIAVPFWIWGPALSPELMYNKNILSIAVPQEIQEGFKNLEQSENFANFLLKTDRFWIDPKNNFYAVSSNPSAHVAWAVIALFYGFLLWRPLGFFLVPWFILCSIGTVYTIQHYAIDSITGFALGLFCIVLSHFLLKLEKRYYSGLRQTPFVYNSFKNDMRKIFSCIFAKSK